jgi:hypothetical protein
MMISGYIEFEFDLPGALLARLVQVGVTGRPLSSTI